MVISHVIEEAIRDRIASGKFGSPEEVLARAIDALDSQEEDAFDFPPDTVEEIRRRNLEGLNQYRRGESISAEELTAELESLDAQDRED